MTDVGDAAHDRAASKGSRGCAVGISRRARAYNLRWFVLQISPMLAIGTSPRQPAQRHLPRSATRPTDMLTAGIQVRSPRILSTSPMVFSIRQVPLVCLF